MGKYDAIEIAKFIIYYCIVRNIPLSNLKLQKLLYFVQAFYLVKFGKSCFKDEIQAWDFGPVVPSVYHVFKQFGAGNIPYVVPNIYDVRDRISKYDQKSILTVLNVFAKYSASDLVKITHRQKPWKDVYKPNHHNIIITPESIKEYFDDK